MSYSIREVARMLNISENTVRKYEDDYNLHIGRDERDRRAYTDEDFNMLSKIVEMKKQGHNIYTIRQTLNLHPEAQEYKNLSLELTPMSEINGAEFVQLMKKGFDDVLKTMQENYRTELAAAKEEIVEEVRQKFKNHTEQMKGENTKLLEYIQREREKEKPKTLLQKIFNKGS